MYVLLVHSLAKGIERKMSGKNSGCSKHTRKTGTSLEHELVFLYCLWHVVQRNSVFQTLDSAAAALGNQRVVTVTIDSGSLQEPKELLEQILVRW